MNYYLTPEQESIRNLARKIAVEKILPIRAELDEKEEFPWQIMKICAEAGLFGLFMAEEYGGFGAGVLENSLAVEEMSRVCLGITVSYAGSGLGAHPIILYGNEDQKKKYLPDIAKGKRLAAFGLTEADADYIALYYIKGTPLNEKLDQIMKDFEHLRRNGRKLYEVKLV